MARRRLVGGHGDPVVPGPALAALALATVALALITAVVPARLAARATPASALRADG